ncbi:MAG: hypothetical protein M3R04_03965, partial [bacterium]|nr:hypothetical protein [bacterium]
GGRPAVAFGSYTVPDGELLYMRADDAEGTSWGAPVVVNSVSGSSFAGVWPSLEVVNGRPAICAAEYDGVGATLKFWRADDATGNAWSSEVALDNTLATIGDVKTSMTVLESVPPVPAVSYRNPSSGTLYYVRANDANGATWAAPQTNLDPTIGSGLRSTLLVVQGNPAISYERSSTLDIYYVRANDAFGGAWGAPVAVETINSCNFPAMLMADGRPAIMFSYTDGANVSQGRIYRAGDDVGSSWSQYAVFYDTTYYTGYAENIGGLPFVLFSDLNLNAPVSCTALRTDGLAWDSPMQVGPINSIGYTWALAAVNGQPAFTAQTASGLPSGSDLMYSRLY